MDYGQSSMGLIFDHEASGGGGKWQRGTLLHTAAVDSPLGSDYHDLYIFRG